MIKVVRFLLFYRYLLAACLVVAFTICFELWSTRPRSPLAEAPASERLAEDLPRKFELVKQLKKRRGGYRSVRREEVEDVLGLPTTENEDYRHTTCLWADKEKNVLVARFAGGMMIEGPLIRRLGDTDWQER
jgi:hypothetical protein